MIWIIFGIVTLLTFLVAFAPLMGPSSNTQSDAEAKAYIAEVKRLRGLIEHQDDPDVLRTRLSHIKRQALKAATAANAPVKPPSRAALVGGLALLLAGALVTYMLVGRPALSDGNALRFEADMQTPIQLLERSLQEDPGRWEGWVLYGRELVNAGRFDEALSAYDRALDLTEGDPEIAEERRAATAFIEQTRRGPTAADIESANELSAEDRAAMIEGMVASLASRLRDDPDNPEGWVRLISSRLTLEQYEALDPDLELLRTTYADNPDMIARILQQSGWTDWDENKQR